VTTSLGKRECARSAPDAVDGSFTGCPYRKFYE
jgi:hypothetical protein